MNYILKLVFILTLIGVYCCPIVECVNSGNITTYEARGGGLYLEYCDHLDRCDTNVGLVCADSGVEVRGICQCKSGFVWEYRKCLQVNVNHGEVCNHPEAECKITLYCAGKDPTSGKYICKCRENFDWFPDSDKCIECDEVVGGSCSDVFSQEKCCKKEYNLICKDGKCACTPGNVPLPDGRCVNSSNSTTYEARGLRLYHEPCDHLDSCDTNVGLVCADSGVEMSGICQCEKGFRWDISKCIQVYVDHGQVCKDHEAECKTTLYCHEINGTSGKHICKCRENFDWFLNSDKCIECEEVVGGSCSDVVSQEKCCKKEYNLICEDGKCACETGNVALPDGRCGQGKWSWWLIIGIAVLFLIAMVGFLLWFFLWYRKLALTYRYSPEVAEEKMKKIIKNPKERNLNVEENYVVS